MSLLGPAESAWFRRRSPLEAPLLLRSQDPILQCERACKPLPPRQQPTHRSTSEKQSPRCQDEDDGDLQQRSQRRRIGVVDLQIPTVQACLYQPRMRDQTFLATQRREQLSRDSLEAV